MAKVETVLGGIDKRLKDPHSRTPSMSFVDEEIKSYTDLFQGSKNYNSKAWEPPAAYPTNMPNRPRGE